MFKLVKKNSHRVFLFFLACFVLFASSSQVTAEDQKKPTSKEITLEEAIAWGFEHSPALTGLQDQVAQLQRQLAMLEAGLNWQADVVGQLDTGNLGSSSFSTGREQAEVEVGVQGRRSYRSGLSLSPKLSLKKELTVDEEPAVGFTFNLTQKLFPWSPSAAEQEYYRTLNTLKKAEENFKWQAETEKINWLEGYLNLLRLQEKVEVAEEEYRLANEEFALIEQRQAIGEAGPPQILAGKASLKQAEYQLKQARNTLAAAEREWQLALGLPATSKVNLVPENPYFQQIKEELAKLAFDWEDDEWLMKVLSANHYQLAAHRHDQQQVREEWEWKQAERKPEITAGGTYNYPEHKWQINLNLNYKLWDGGKKRLEEEEHQALLRSLERDYQYLMENLHSQLQKLLHQFELAKLNLEAVIFQEEKAALEAEVYRKQLAAGLITEQEWARKAVAAQIVQISREEAEDRVFLAKLRILRLVGLI